MAVISSCTSEQHNLGNKVVKNWINWNILFDKGKAADTASFNYRLKEVKEYVESYVKAYNDTSKKTIRPGEYRFVGCKCDPYLNRLEVDLRMDTSTGETRVPPTPPPTPGVSGGSVNENTALYKPYTEMKMNFPRKTMKLTGNLPYKLAPILAVIDTGIDTTLFSSGINNIIWKAPAGLTTLTNFIYPAGAGGFQDDHFNYHGTNVSSIILNEFADVSYPRLMVLKAMDSLGSGTVFSVSCAMSYAIQNKASLINMSFGYFGNRDTVLAKYFSLANKDSITLVCAAGNASGARENLCNAVVNPNNELKPGHLFFPACFSKEFPANVITVVGLNEVPSPCHYQNYSNDYVTLGVKNSINCCFFNSLISATSIEGSSFSTPVASGLIGRLKLNETNKRLGIFYLQSILASQTPALSPAEIATAGSFIKAGNFVVNQ
jgi:hypothetical protein